jgi:hypothetical protein
MSTETEVKQDAVQELRGHVDHLAMEVSLLREQIRTQINSRRGLEGPRGESIVGPAGRDAVLRVVVDGKENVIHVFGEDGTEKATLVAVSGPAGRDGVSPPPAKDGRNGADGKSAPSLSEIVSAVLAELKRRWMN